LDGILEETTANPIILAMGPESTATKRLKFLLKPFNQWELWQDCCAKGILSSMPYNRITTDADGNIIFNSLMEFCPKQ